MTPIRPEESIAIIESQGFIAAAKLAQVIGSETRARIAGVSPMSGMGVVTTLLAGTLADVQYAIQVAKSQSLAVDTMFMARPNAEVLEMLLASVMSPVQTAVKKQRPDETLPLFSVTPERIAPESVVKAKATPAPRAMRDAKPPSLSVTERFTQKASYELQELNVHELRRYARSIPGFPITGREISRANRPELLQMIKSHVEAGETRAARESRHGLTGTLPS